MIGNMSITPSWTEYQSHTTNI